MNQIYLILPAKSHTKLDKMMIRGCLLIFSIRSVYFSVLQFFKIRDPVMKSIYQQLAKSEGWQEEKPNRAQNVFKIKWDHAYAAIALGGPNPLFFNQFDCKDYSSAHQLLEKHDFETVKQKIEANESNEHVQAEVLSAQAGWLGKFECVMVEMHYARSDGWEVLLDYRAILGSDGWIQVSAACTFSDSIARREILHQLAKIQLERV